MEKAASDRRRVMNSRDLLSDALVVVMDSGTGCVISFTLQVVLLDLCTRLHSIGLDGSTKLVGCTLPVTIGGMSGVVVGDTVVVAVGIMGVGRACWSDDWRTKRRSSLVSCSRLQPCGAGVCAYNP